MKPTSGSRQQPALPMISPSYSTTKSVTPLASESSIERSHRVVSSRARCGGRDQ